MTAYAINKVCWLANRDDDYRRLIRVDPEDALRRAVPRLSDDERIALLGGDVGALVAMGASRYLLASLGRRRLFGLDSASYRLRLQEAIEASASVRSAMYPALWSDGTPQHEGSRSDMNVPNSNRAMP